MNARPRLLYLITEDWYFWSHRLDLARAAVASGFDVALATRVTDHETRILKEGVRLFPIRLSRRSKNPLAELLALAELTRLYKRERPAVVHHVGLKPILYGSIAARLASVPTVVNAFAGLGYLFTDEDRQGRFLNKTLGRVLRAVLTSVRSTVIFQNHDDRDLLIKERVVTREQSRIIPGSGVDVSTFTLRPPSGEGPIVMLASRMLWDKGIGEFIEAVRRLKSNGVSARFVLVGRCDEHNPAAILEETVRSWAEEGLVEWWGHREDMPATLALATIAVLPSYREGLPKSLLEAAACGKPMVATDVPGCREILVHGVTGLLVPPKDSAALAAAIHSLLDDPALRTEMGVAARELVVRSFSVETVTEQVIRLYRELLAGKPPGVS
ncbi:Alpha-D-QuiNAc alpha-1,3-galactosyltransferase [Nitrospira japonica]|uniref:Alpha-D-QuiNAc alpha-1,3-galactosyltransferase n=1 Tax=Nitrospira japonica TaxID=1325564 RepID=A0A1W1IB67_9BACT|nr:glycosyltransferase family 4 protein [Nitrospira japonica]SLM50297.1 Alpha-D-QuiNAc alpha-1,3-galactosyltransferase [Nitrospira japonica]